MAIPKSEAIAKVLVDEIAKLLNEYAEGKISARLLLIKIEEQLQSY